MAQTSSKIGGGLLVAVLLAGSYTFSVLNPGGGGTQQPAGDTSTPAVYVPPATKTPTSSTAPGTSVTPCSNCGGGGSLPHHILAGYWHNFTNGSTALRLNNINANYSLIIVAFTNTDPGKPGTVTFSIDPSLSSALGGYSQDAFINDITTLHAQGKKVIISVGGQNSSVSVNSADTATNFANSIHELMKTYGFDGVDIDLEQGINANSMASALRQLSALAGPDLIITLAPQTLDMQSTGHDYFQLALNIKDILTVVNTQFYNSGTMLGCDGKVYAQGTVDFLTAQACIQLQGGLRPDQIGLGLPAIASAAGSGYVAPSVVNDALSCLAAGKNCGSFKPSTTYPDIRGAMTWSINWDATSSYNFANTVGSHLGTLSG
ncbi:hypothetical protein KSF_064160 [Reticulibacter mediterranei]|uniref:chitinase n=1 Tax=Reticulibacter mediterranei TaxID=2778369 RepID=A0A8J3N5D1_9CHLR|nr:chitinase [Reticulibacter mediterranei]GHO96368.1 hypothetical protein KSF_064160 [Reticulibacter mediterranei]